MFRVHLFAGGHSPGQCVDGQYMNTYRPRLNEIQYVCFKVSHENDLDVNVFLYVLYYIDSLYQNF